MNTQPTPEAQGDAGRGAAPSWSTRPRPASPVPWKILGAAVAAVAAGAVLWAGLTVPGAPPALDAGENLSTGDLAQLATNREALEYAGLAAGTAVYVRDFGMVDGDAVVFNGATIPLQRLPIMLNVTPGPIELMAVAGSTGCVTVEVGDGAGVYQLCLRDGDPVRTRAR